jgi:Na+/proline symporter
MVGASISGLTFIGVPGWVMGIDMTYMQMCLGFIPGYLLVAFVLLPVYYRLGTSSIYSFLGRRFGPVSYHTAAAFFLLSKMLGAAAKFYVVVQILQHCVGSQYGLPYWFTALCTLLFIWLYTHRGGIQAIVWTDALQTFVLLAALLLILEEVCRGLGMGYGDALKAVWSDPHSRILELDDWTSRQYFWKQFLSGMFVVLVMTGLDQDMMQKNLTCKNLRSAQLDMCSYGLLFAPVNFLFLSLGVLLLMLYGRMGMPLPAKGDALLSDMVYSGQLGPAALVLFTVGVVASAFSSADSALTALTTCFCVDILGREHDEAVRKRVHVGMMLVFLLCTLAFNAIGSGSVMDLIYSIVGYTYGPLLGLFAFGLLTKRQPRDRAVPYIAVASPLVCLLADRVAWHCLGYKFGYEILMLNGLLTFAGLWFSQKPKDSCILSSSGL